VNDPVTDRQSQDPQLIVEDVVTALTGEVEAILDADRLRSQMERAAEEFDRRTANAFGRALLDSLCEDPGNLRLLEALVILGLAHPDVLSEHRISLAVEGRRLAVLLERSGDPDRARSVLELLASNMPSERTIDQELAGVLRRSGKTEELVERYLARAEECIRDGKTSEAIPWLQEILLLDRTRRDVARMIRDLRYQEAEKANRSKRRWRLLLILLLVSTGVSALIAREVSIGRAYDNLPEARLTTPGSLTQRRAGLQAMLDNYRIWSGMVGVTQERDTLDTRIADHEREMAAESRRAAKVADQRQEMAEAARMRGLMHSERGEFDQALISFREALERSQLDWEHRPQLVVDVAAIEEWQAAQGE
jgi:tetratricopeptide (TPR) repeat protein